MLLIALAGKARVGKDTIGRHLVSVHGFEHYYFAKPLKDMAGALGFPEAEFQTTEQKESVIPDIGRSYRYLLQTLGTEWGRNLIDQNLWLKMAARRWKAECARAQNLRDEGMQFAHARMVITDCRFENEASWVRDVGGVVVHVHGNGQTGMAEAQRAHQSEQSLGWRSGDQHIFNLYETPSRDTFRALYASVDALVNGLLTERGFA